MKPQDRAPDLLSGADTQSGGQTDAGTETQPGGETAAASDAAAVGDDPSEGAAGADAVAKSGGEPDGGAELKADAKPQGKAAKAKHKADASPPPPRVRLVMQTSLLSDVRGEQVARDRHAMASELLAHQLVAAGRARIAADGEADPLGRPVLDLD